MSPSGRRKRKDGDELTDPGRERRKIKDRRTHASGKPKAEGSVRFDSRGNAVWELRLDEETPRRREEDPTVDLLKCLDIDGLEIKDEEDQPSTEADKKEKKKYSPYSRG